MAASLEGLSARGLVSLERAEDILQRVIDQVNAQSMQIAGLVAVIETLVDRNTMARALSSVDEALSRMDRHVATMQDAMHVPGMSADLSIGQVVAAQGLGLSSACEQLARKADADDVAEQLEQGRRATQARFDEVYDWAASRELVGRLQDAGRATHVQVQALEQGLACKMDKAEAGHVETALSRLKAFNGFVDDTNRRLTGLESDVSGLSSELSSEARAAEAMGQRVTRAEKELQQGRALREEMVTALQDMRACRERLDSKADAQALREALQHQRDMDTRLTALQEEYGSWRAETRAILTEINRELEQTAPLEEVGRKLDSRVWDRNWRVALERLDRKAEAGRVEGLAARLDRAEQVLGGVERKSELALRFVDWFSERGQAYEHNLHTLDRTLGRLAQGSLPGRRRPGDGRVRFTTEEHDSPPPAPRDYRTDATTTISPPAPATAAAAAAAPPPQQQSEGGSGGGRSSPSSSSSSSDPTGLQASA